MGPVAHRARALAWGIMLEGGTQMEKLKKLGLVLRDVVEIYIPVTSFVIMFLVFILQIFCRYVLRQPLQWAYEVTVSCYLWTVVLGACLAQRSNSHVVFTLIYDKMGIKGKAITSFLGNALIAFAMIYSFVDSVEFIDFMKMQRTSVLKIGLNFVYMPYIAFMVMITIYMLIDMYKDARLFLGLASPEEVRERLRENMSEAELAIEDAKEIENAKEDEA